MLSLKSQCGFMQINALFQMRFFTFRCMKHFVPVALLPPPDTIHHHDALLLLLPASRSILNSLEAFGVIALPSTLASPLPMAHVRRYWISRLNSYATSKLLRMMMMSPIDVWLLPVRLSLHDLLPRSLD